ncbi:MAG TPA: hypothetical protein VIQ99_02665 [Gammaproteobacteria bacterium]
MRHKSATPWLVALACFGPFLAALLLYYGPWGPSWLPQLPGSRELLAQAVPLPEAWRSGTAAHAWQLIYARMSPCEQQCAQHLGRLLQVQLALGRDREQVQRVVWYVGEQPPLSDSALLARSLDDAAGREVVAALGAAGMAEGRIYVADPQGSVILGYPADVEQKELLRDLKRLLAGSH